MHERRKTIGLRVPQNVIAQELLATLGEPLISCTLIFPGESSPVDEPEDWRQLLDNNVDVVVNGGACGIEPTTILDLSGEQVRVDRRGKGSVEMLGL